MELLQLKYFCHAASTQNFARTAEAFHVPPSNISHCIKRLEDELQVTLFDRTANRARLNAQGRMFYEGIREALTLIENTTAAIHDTKDSGVIRIAVQLNMNIAMRAILHFRRLYPDVKVETTHFYGEVPDGDFDLMITNSVPSENIWETRHVLHDRFVLVAPKGLLSPGTSADPQEMRDLPYITMSPDSLIYRDTLNICSQLGFTPRIVHHSESSSYLPVCVEQGVGAALLPLLNWSWALDRQQVDVREVGDFYRDTWLHMKKRRFIPALVRELHGMLAEEFALRTAHGSTPV